MSVFTFAEIDPSPMATQALEFFERLENDGYTRSEINAMTPEAYSEYLASTRCFDL